MKSKICKINLKKLYVLIIGSFKGRTQNFVGWPVCAEWAGQSAAQRVRKKHAFY